MSQILAAEKERDAEFERLQARHLRDKQIISALKLKMEKQQLALLRAEDVPEHEVDTYLDLLEGTPGGKKHNALLAAGGAVRPASSGDDDALSGSETPSDMEEYQGLVSQDQMQDSAHDLQDEDDEERSMSALLREQDEAQAQGKDVQTAEWTRKMIEDTQKRRKDFKKKRLEEA